MFRPKFNTAQAGFPLLILRRLQSNGGFSPDHQEQSHDASHVIATAIVLSLGGLAGYLLPLL
jgi:hypothetical protein